MQFSNDAKQMKFEVLTRVAALSFEDRLEEKRDGIPYEIIPGSEPHFRCCVYKEREIIRERVSAAMGKHPRGEEAGAVVAVLPAACEGCPINRYTVTDNCQRCMAKKCVAACPFGAITVTGRGAYIDPAKCKECGRCAAACPYNAISDTMRPCMRTCPVDAISIDTESRRAVIKEERCIGCGACTNDCPFGAISDVSQMTRVIDWLKSGKKVFAAVAPAIEGQFGNANLSMLRAALQKLGFYDAAEVALGADAVAAHEAQEVKAAMLAGSHLTTSCCPAFVAMIEKHFPRLLPAISSTISPMGAVARYLKEKNPGALVVFIGPCIAKKQELQNPANGADGVLTFEELAAMFAARSIDPERFEGAVQEASRYGKGFAVSGGVAGAVLQALSEQGEEEPASYQKANGARECKKLLAMLNAGRMEETLLEGMACENGCVAGPCSLVPLKQLLKRREAMLKDADGRTIAENLEKYDFTGVNLER